VQGAGSRGLPVGREPRRPRIRPEWEQPASERGSSPPAVTPVDWTTTASELARRSVLAARGCQWALDWTGWSRL
jgi:hypothetical protein